MSMFCFQCQEAAKNTGCTTKGVCGKTDEVANLQDLLVCAMRGVAIYAERAKEEGITRKGTGAFLADGLFTTITNANYDPAVISSKIDAALELRDELKGLVSQTAGQGAAECSHKCATWSGDASTFTQRGKEVGVLSVENEDARSLRELLMYGLKGIAAYAHHAAVLGKEDEVIYDFLIEGLAATTKDLKIRWWGWCSRPGRWR